MKTGMSTAERIGIGLCYWCRTQRPYPN